NKYKIAESPCVYNFGGTIAYVDSAKVQVLGHSRLKHEVNRAAQFYKPGEKGNRPCDAPNDVIEDLLATRPSQIPLPKLKQIVNVPIFARDGRLVQKPGFDEASGIFLEPSLEIAPVSQAPSKEELDQAVETLRYTICD